MLLSECCYAFGKVANILSLEIVAPVVKVVELNVMPICVGVKKKQKCVHPVFRKRYHGGASRDSVKYHASQHRIATRSLRLCFAPSSEEGEAELMRARACVL